MRFWPRSDNRVFPLTFSISKEKEATNVDLHRSGVYQALQMLSLAWVIVTDPGQAGIVLQAMDSLSLIWTVGLSVLGIYVYKRSEDKRRN